MRPSLRIENEWKIATFRIFLYILSKFEKIGWTVSKIVNSNRNF